MGDGFWRNKIFSILLITHLSCDAHNLIPLKKKHDLTFLMVEVLGPIWSKQREMIRFQPIIVLVTMRAMCNHNQRRKRTDELIKVIKKKKL